MILTDIMNLFYSFFLIIYSVSCCLMDEFSDDKFETLLTFYDLYFYLVITNRFLLKLFIIIIIVTIIIIIIIIIINFKRMHIILQSAEYKINRLILDT